MMKKLFLVTLLTGLFAGCAQTDGLKQAFIDPPNEFKPMPFWHLNGHLTPEGIERQITEAVGKSGYGGMTVLPVSPGPHWIHGYTCPGMAPEYLSDDYFDRYGDMLAVSEKLGSQIILYDDTDFPSGSAGGRLAALYPEYTRKFLVKNESLHKGGAIIKIDYDFGDNAQLLALSAMDTVTREVIDLAPFMEGDRLEWNAPSGREWLVMAFTSEYGENHPHSHLVDYMQPEAVAKVIEMTYDNYDRFSRYFGNVIRKTFFDDVGFVHSENTWNPAISDLFRTKTGRNPALYYPALFYDIGPETQPARVAFFDARSELMAEGYVRQAAEWSEARNMRSMGHPPENYSPNSVVANGDILKYYRHAHIPLLDIIFFYGRGLNGYKQITSAADRGDKPLVGAELNGAFPADMDSLTLYRTVMEAMARGVNFLVPHGLWYDPTPDSIRIPPLISWDNPYWGDAVRNYSAFTSRSCVMLQGGRRVVDVAMLWPIAAIQGETWIYRDDESPLPVANWLPDNVNHYELSGILTNEVRRDFTYIHPEDLTDGTLIVENGRLVLDNDVNRQDYRVLMMPGGDVISADAMQAIYDYYLSGGKVIATSSLPFRSAEFGRDGDVRKIVDDIFGTIPSNETFIGNPNGGMFAFLPTAGREELDRAFEKMGLAADVAFDRTGMPQAPVGYVNYTHKQKDGRDIYYFINTTDSPLSTEVTLRGRLHKPELWDPHSGNIVPAGSVRYENGNTIMTLTLDPVQSVFVVARM